MRDCERFRIACAADLGELDSDIASHSDGCPDCAKFAQSMRELDRQLLASLCVKVPHNLVDSLKDIPERSGRNKPRRLVFAGFVLAASILLGVGLSSMHRVDSIFRPVPLEQVVYQHVLGEPQALTSAFPVYQALLNTTLKDFGISLKKPIGNVIYVRFCPVGDTHGLHLVVQGKRGPVTFLFLPTKTLDKPIVIGRGRFTGYVKPSLHGVVAILGEKGEQLEEAETAVQAALKWL